MQVRYDERAVYRISSPATTPTCTALGFVPQDRLFQMELRRLARGELAEVLGPCWSIPTACSATWASASMPTVTCRPRPQQPLGQGAAGLPGRHQPVPGQPPAAGGIRPAGHRETPLHPRGHGVRGRLHGLQLRRRLPHRAVLTHIRDQLGADYLKVFDLDWHPGGAVAQRLGRDDWRALDSLAASACRRWKTPACRSSRAAMPGRWPAAVPPAASRCWPAIRISVSPRRRCGTRRT